MLLKKFIWYVEVFSPYLMAAKCKTLSSVVWYFVVVIKYVDVASSVNSLPPWDKHIYWLTFLIFFDISSFYVLCTMKKVYLLFSVQLVVVVVVVVMVVGGGQ